MKRTDRRSFILRAVATTSVLGLAHTPALADVDESDPVAVALGYRADTKKVDSTKYPSHDGSQQCANCKQFQGKAGDRSGGCSLFGGKTVAAAGWCSAWVKKA
jgi:High potential iron-sulfur protein